MRPGRVEKRRDKQYDREGGDFIWTDRRLT